MELIFALLIGGLFAAGIYMMLRRSIVRLIIGLALIGYAANLLIFVSAKLVQGVPPIVPDGKTQLTGAYADPLTQALILTSIVISFGVMAFAVVLIHRTYQMIQTDDIDVLCQTDAIGVEK